MISRLMNVLGRMNHLFLKQHSVAKDISIKLPTGKQKGMKSLSIEFAIERVKLRVTRGGHNIPEQVIRRRFEKSLLNFNIFYKLLADSWIIFDTSGNLPIILEESE